MRACVAAVALLLGGCLSHMPRDERPEHLAIRWERDFESARRAATAQGRPMLVCLVAGDMTDHC